MLYLFEGRLDNMFSYISSRIEFSIYRVVDGEKVLVDDFREIVKLVRVFAEQACTCEFNSVHCALDENRSSDTKVVLKYSIELTDQDRQGLSDLCNQCTNVGEVYLSVVC